MKWFSPKEIPREKENLLLKIGFEDEEDYYIQSGYYEKGKWFTWNGCANLVCGSNYIMGWIYEV